MFACTCVAAALAAGCSDDDESESAPGPPPLATESIGSYKFDDAQTAQDADAARRATGRYLDERNARDDGYEPQPSADAPVCNDPPGKGDGGIEYVNEGLIGDELDVRRPPVLYYEPDEFGGRRLTALQYRAPEGESDAKLFNQTLDGGSLTVWLYLFNPDGVFADGNVTSKCPPGPPVTPPEPGPRRGGGAPGGPPPGADGGGGGGGPPPGAQGGGGPP